MTATRSGTLAETLDKVSSGLDKNITKAKEVILEDDSLLSRATRMPYFPLVIDRAEGSRVWDVDGNEYIDFLASAATVVLGHSPLSVVEAVKNQIDKLMCYNIGYVYHKPVVELSRKLSDITPGRFPKRTSFGLSGSDAVDGAYHLARAFTGRQQFLSFRGAYHGVTMGAHNLSAIDSGMKCGSVPILPGITHLPFPDTYRCPFGTDGRESGQICLDWIESLFRTEVSPSEIAGLIVEPIQGDGGIIVPPEGFLGGLAKICKREGILFIAEEVQTGFGRTGMLFGVDHEEVIPDILVLGKGLGGGMPVSALVARAEIMEAPDWKPPAHTFTHGGNPPACVAALAVIQQILAEDLVDRSRVLGDQLKTELHKIADEFEIIGDVRGSGLMVGVDIVSDRDSKTRGFDLAKKICFRCWEKGLILTFLNGNVLRFTPALNIPEDLLWRGLEILQESIKDVLDGKVGDEVLTIAVGR